MDPEVALAELRTCVYMLRTILDGGKVGDWFASSWAVIERIEALDKWLSDGGFPPKPWNRETYNGHANRETWCLGLWLSNSEDLYFTARDIASGAPPDEAAENMRTWVVDVLWPERYTDSQPMILDVGSLWRIDWPSIVSHLRDEE